MALHHIVYISMAGGDMDPTQTDLQALLAQAVRHNTAAGITGMLLYAYGGFMQVIEGEQTAVEALFGRIGQDERHSRVTPLLQGPIAERSFGEWAMAYRCLDSEPAQALPAELVPFFHEGFDESRLRARPGVALQLLRYYSRNNGLVEA